VFDVNLLAIVLSQVLMPGLLLSKQAVAIIVATVAISVFLL